MTGINRKGCLVWATFPVCGSYFISESDNQLLYILFFLGVLLDVEFFVNGILTDKFGYNLFHDAYRVQYLS